MELMRHFNSPILNTEAFVFALAIRDVNMTALYPLTQECTSCYLWHELPLHVALTDGGHTFPFDFHSDKQVFSFVTCSGQVEDTNALGTLLEPFDWTIWITILSCVTLFLAYICLSSGQYNMDSNAKNCISLVLGALGCAILIADVIRHGKLAVFLLVWSWIGILVGNLYQAQWTESLILPLQYNTTLTLVDIVARNFTVLLIADQDREILYRDDEDRRLFSFCGTSLQTIGSGNSAGCRT